MNNIAAVIVTYNRKTLLEECIHSLLSQTVPCDIMVINNASTDGTDELMASFESEPRVIHMRQSENLGGAGGFSVGTKLAYQAGYEYIWLMDDDCIPQQDALEMFLAAGEKLGGNYGFLSSKVLYTDGSLCFTNIQRYPMRKLVTDFDSELVPITYGTFVSMFFKREIVKELGIPIKEFFIWSDDLEYCGRISIAAKYPCYLCNRSVVYHKTKGNNGINIAIEAPERLPRFKYIYRNDVYVFRRHGLKGWCFLFVRMLYHIYKILRYSDGHKLEKIGMVVKGNIDGLTFNPEIEFP